MDSVVAWILLFWENDRKWGQEGFGLGLFWAV
jgi:hypothetical protein